jgi:hypothetical protein
MVEEGVVDAEEVRSGGEMSDNDVDDVDCVEEAETVDETSPVPDWSGVDVGVELEVEFGVELAA